MTFEQAFLFLQHWQIALPIVLATMAAFFLFKRPWTALYVGLMPFINWSYSAVPTMPIPHELGGGNFQPLAIVTGFVLVVRDFAQREIKHWIFGAMIVGLFLSSLTSWIVIVFASGAAFLISETVDWAVYTFVKRPLSERVLLSSCASGPLDQIVFIWLASMAPGQAGIFAWGTILTGVASKLIGAYIVSRVMRVQERRAAAANEMKPA